MCVVLGTIGVKGGAAALGVVLRGVLFAAQGISFLGQAIDVFVENFKLHARG